MGWCGLCFVAVQTAYQCQRGTVDYGPSAVEDHRIGDLGQRRAGREVAQLRHGYWRFAGLVGQVRRLHVGIAHNQPAGHCADEPMGCVGGVLSTRGRRRSGAVSAAMRAADGAATSAISRTAEKSPPLRVSLPTLPRWRFSACEYPGAGCRFPASAAGVRLHAWTVTPPLRRWPERVFRVGLTGFEPATT